MRRAIFLMTTVMLLTSAAPAPAKDAKLDKPKPVRVSGKVLDTSGNPIRDAQVFLIDHERRLRLSDRTDADGMFDIKHERVGFDSLQIVPPLETHLAQAILKDMPAKEGRHVVVNLKPGVQVIGRVLAAGHPLKGVTVRAIAKSSDAIHDSAEAVTNKKGQYELLLTPGEKIFEISDVQDNAVVGLHRVSEIVRAAGALPDIDVPANRTASDPK
jgi:hypothetical protein